MSAIYKQGQGYWTRLMSAVGLGLMGAMGGLWLHELLANARVGGVEPVYVQWTAAVLFFGVFAIAGYIFIGRKARTVDFMIATEQELKKVHWSSRKEIVGSTWVVIGLTLMTAVMLWLFDLLFSWIAAETGVLQTG